MCTGKRKQFNSDLTVYLCSGILHGKASLKKKKKKKKKKKNPYLWTYFFLACYRKHSFFCLSSLLKRHSELYCLYMD